MTLHVLRRSLVLELADFFGEFFVQGLLVERSLGERFEKLLHTLSLGAHKDDCSLILVLMYLTLRDAINMSTNHGHSNPNGHQTGLSNGSGEDMGLLTEYLPSDGNSKSTHSTGQGSSLKEEIEHLRSLLPADQEDSHVDESNFEGDLALLDNADEVASDVENRLDEMLDTLNGLLSKLEGRDPDEDTPMDSTVAKS